MTATGWPSSHALPLALLACLAGCVVPDVAFEPRMGRLDVSGELVIAVGSGNATASADELGLGADNSAFQPALALDWGRISTTFEGLFAKFEGEGTANANISFGGEDVIVVGAPIGTEVEIDIVTARASYDLLASEAWELGLGAGVGLLDYLSEVESLQGDGGIRTEGNLPFAFLSGTLGRSFGRFELRGTINGAAAELQDEALAFTDIDLGASYRFVGRRGRPLGMITLGFRSLDIDYRFEDGENDVQVDLSFVGPYLGLRFGF